MGNVVLRNHATLGSVAAGADAELTLALTVRPLKILFIEGIGMVGSDYNADTASVWGCSP